MLDLSQYGILKGALGAPLNAEVGGVSMTIQSVSIKADAADFEVTEIDPNHVRVDGHRYEHPNASPEVAQPAPLPQCPGLMHVGPNTVGVLGTGVGIDETTLLELLSTTSLSEEEAQRLADELEAFAAFVVPRGHESASTVRSAWNASIGGTAQAGYLAALEERLPRCEGTNEIRPSFVLGSYSCKTWRSYVRGTIRYLHPMLDVTTLPQSTILVVYPCMERHLEDAKVLQGGMEDVITLCRNSLLGPLGSLCRPPAPNRPSRRPPNLVLSFTEDATHEQRTALYNRYTDAQSDSFEAGSKHQRDETPVYTHMVAHSTNIDFMEMSNIIAQGLSLMSRTTVNSGELCIAGIKDKRAVTHQRVSIKGDYAILKKQREVRLVDDKSIPTNHRSLRLTNIQPRPYQLSLGQLSGNAFTIKATLDFGCAPDGVGLDDIAKAIRSSIENQVEVLSSKGFPNFFGLQRFNKQPTLGADPTLLTRHVGMYMLRGDFISAVDSVLFGEGGGAYEAFEGLKAELLTHWDVDAVSKRAPSGMRDWSSLLGGLRSSLRRRGSMDAVAINEAREFNSKWVGASFGGRGDTFDGQVPSSHSKWAVICQDAISSLPFHLSQLWVHSAQSLVYNLTLSNLILQGAATYPTLPLIPACPVASPAGPDGRRRLLNDYIGGITADDKLREALRSALTLPGCPLMSEGAVYPATGGLPTKVSGVPLKRSDRAAAVVATNLSITDLTCRLAEGRVVVAVSLSYDLPSSCYATIFLASLFGVMPIG